MDRRTLRVAAEWFALLRDDSADEADRRRWREWLDAHAAHREAWARVEAVEGELRGLPRKPARAAFTAADASRRRALKTLGMLAVAAPVAWLAGRRLPWDAWQADYRTAVGEIRDVRLADGTRVWLNTDTALDVTYTREARRLELHRGEVVLETTPDERPLTLATTHGDLRPLGTRFGARLQSGHTLAYVERGAVEAHPVRGGAARLGAGRMATLDSGGVGTAQPLPSGRGAWTDGLLIANGDPLGDVLAELARYRTGYLGWSDAVADIRVIGTYPVAETERVLDALERSLPVEVERRTRWWVTVKPH
ncbi:FecR domain-containing protein [Aquisalimonas lutea]|uniref:FecR domain-containing protein n=1 Tax=Aquisalimonas lutea TaxID=1327750 RepID=UPI0025B493B8|nr:FecR domain-containing protein [Aquisalimonas lutea]MDN3516657.1 FecR domain-containing protein [Aquisalimonas lutea]